MTRDQEAILALTKRVAELEAERADPERWAAVFLDHPEEAFRQKCIDAIGEGWHEEQLDRLRTERGRLRDQVHQMITDFRESSADEMAEIGRLKAVAADSNAALVDLLETADSCENCYLASRACRAALASPLPAAPDTRTERLNAAHEVLNEWQSYELSADARRLLSLVRSALKGPMLPPEAVAGQPNVAHQVNAKLEEIELACKEIVAGANLLVCLCSLADGDNPVCARHGYDAPRQPPESPGQPAAERRGGFDPDPFGVQKAIDAARKPPEERGGAEPDCGLPWKIKSRDGRWAIVDRNALVIGSFGFLSVAEFVVERCNAGGAGR